MAPTAPGDASHGRFLNRCVRRFLSAPCATQHQTAATHIAAQSEGGKRDSGGRYRVSISRFFHGTIKGGGQQIEFTTMNGTIHIRKKTR